MTRKENISDVKKRKGDLKSRDDLPVFKYVIKEDGKLVMGKKTLKEANNYFNKRKAAIKGKNILMAMYKFDTNKRRWVGLKQN
jgi:hypothetical protein